MVDVVPGNVAPEGATGLGVALVMLFALFAVIIVLLRPRCGGASHRKDGLGPRALPVGDLNGPGLDWHYGIVAGDAQRRGAALGGLEEYGRKPPPPSVREQLVLGVQFLTLLAICGAWWTLFAVARATVESLGLPSGWVE